MKLLFLASSLLILSVFSFAQERSFIDSTSETKDYSNDIEAGVYELKDQFENIEFQKKEKSNFRVNSDQYTLSCDDVTITEGVIIAYNANYTNIEIPSELCGETVIGIGENAFRSKGLIKVVFPETLEEIQKSAFNNNNLIETLDVSSVKNFGNYAFQGNSITNLILSPDIQSLGVYSFSFNELKEISIPTGLKVIADGAFAHNYITTVQMAETIEIGSAAFTNNNIETVNGVPSDGVFYSKIVDNVPDKSILVAYGGTANVVDFLSNETKVITRYAFKSSSVFEIILPSQLEAIETYAFENNIIAEIDLPNTITFIEKDAFKNTPLLLEIQLPENSSDNFGGWLNDDNEEVTVITDFTSSYRANLPYTLTANDVEIDQYGIITSCLKRDIPYLIVPSQIDGINIRGINDYVFRYKNIYELALGDDIRVIGKYAFANNKLLKVQLPSNLQRLTYGVFRYNQLTALSLPSSLRSIQSYVFANNHLASVTFDQPEHSHIYSIRSRVFDENNDLKSVITPWKDEDGVNFTIQEFEMSYSLKKDYTLTCDDVILNENGEIILFFGVGGVDVTIPEELCGQKVTGIKGEYENFHELATLEASSIRELYFPSSFRTIGHSAFNYNYILDVSLPSNLLEIGEQAFKYNFIETTIDIPEKVRIIGSSAFQYNKYEKVSIPLDGDLIYLGENAFAVNNEDNLSIQLPNHDENADFEGWHDSENTYFESGQIINNHTTFYEATGIENTMYSLDISIEQGEGEVTPFIGQNQFYKGQVIDLSVTPQEGLTFLQWEINGEKVSDLNTTIELNENTIVKVYFNEEVISSIDVEDAIKVYPIPVMDILRVELQSNNNVVQVVNASGIVLETINFEGKTVALDFSNYQKGMYFLVAISKTTGDKLIKKIIK